MEIDTIRILVDWKCNLSCNYCCNEQERFRREIEPVTLESIRFDKYKFVCISGGEPLLFMDRVKKVCERASGKFMVFYTNATLFTPEHAQNLASWGINAVNVGLHYPLTFGSLIKKTLACFEGIENISVRFHAQNIYESNLRARFPNVSFRYWEMDDCERDNEDRVVLIQ